MIFSKFWAPNMSQNRLRVFEKLFLGPFADIPRNILRIVKKGLFASLSDI